MLCTLWFYSKSRPSWDLSLTQLGGLTGEPPAVPWPHLTGPDNSPNTVAEVFVWPHFGEEKEEAEDWPQIRGVCGAKDMNPGLPVPDSMFVNLVQ